MGLTMDRDGGRVCVFLWGVYKCRSGVMGCVFLWGVGGGVCTRVTTACCDVDQCSNDVVGCVCVFLWGVGGWGVYKCCNGVLGGMWTSAAMVCWGVCVCVCFYEVLGGVQVLQWCAGMWTSTATVCWGAYVCFYGAQGGVQVL